MSDESLSLISEESLWSQIEAPLLFEVEESLSLQNDDALSSQNADPLAFDITDPFALASEYSLEKFPYLYQNCCEFTYPGMFLLLYDPVGLTNAVLITIVFCCSKHIPFAQHVLILLLQDRIVNDAS